MLKGNVKLLGTARDAHTRTTKCRVDNGQYQDKIKKARDYVYMSGGFLNSKYLETCLDRNPLYQPVCIKQSFDERKLIYPQNAFSYRLSRLGFNFFSMFVPDLLHEFELGVWKAIFKHLIRILYAQGNDFIQMLNDRYVNHPTFTAQLSHS